MCPIQNLKNILLQYLLYWKEQGARISIDKSNPTIKPTNNLGGEELRKEFVQLSIESPKIKNGIKIKSRIAITKNAHLILLCLTISIKSDLWKS
ncbi:MAG: hypothetical protein ACXVHT_03095 [Methanobacterium sp.]